MEKKRSKGILAFGWFELLIGAILLFIALKCYIYLPKLAQADSNLGYAMTSIEYFFSFWIGIFFIFSGLLILFLKPLGRWLHLIWGFCFMLFGLIKVYIVVYMYLHYSNTKLSKEFILGILLIILGSITRFFFSRPKVKEQFKY